MFSKLKAISIFKTKRDYTVPPIPESVWKNPWHFIAFGFGTGCIPVAPGTFGTLIAIPLYLYLTTYSQTFYLIFLLAFIAFSMWLSEKVSREINVQDHQGMNIDEIAGFLVTMFHAPYGWGWIILGVILFRIFDILKPWPIKQVDERMHGGVGVVLDDVLAGIYSLIIIQIIARIALL